jgi:hypothetical protein
MPDERHESEAGANIQKVNNYFKKILTISYCLSERKYVWKNSCSSSNQSSNSSKNSEHIERTTFNSPPLFRHQISIPPRRLKKITLLLHQKLK